MQFYVDGVWVQGRSKNTENIENHEINDYDNINIIDDFEYNVDDYKGIVLVRFHHLKMIIYYLVTVLLHLYRYKIQINILMLLR